MKKDQTLLELCTKYGVLYETIEKMVECERKKQGLARKHGLPDSLRQIIEDEVDILSKGGEKK
ncbi:MAG: hypothetical protein V1799_14010 [bacterium]